MARFRYLSGFALEAKCYDPPSKGVGAKEPSRQISRLRHDQFGILVATSYLGITGLQGAEEDGYPVVVICGTDIAGRLKTKIRKYGSGQKVAGRAPVKRFHLI